MKRVKKIIHLSVLFVFLFATIGVNVYTHFCKKDGVSTSFFIKENSNCDSEKTIESCCSKATKNTCASTFISEEKCCSESSFSLKLSSDFNSHELFQKIFVSELSFPTFEYFKTLPFSKNLIVDYSDPPPISGKQRLVHYQIFRI